MKILLTPSLPAATTVVMPALKAFSTASSNGWYLAPATAAQHMLSVAVAEEGNEYIQMLRLITALFLRFESVIFLTIQSYVSRM